MHFATVSIQILDSYATVLANYSTVFLDLHFEVGFLDTIKLEPFAIFA